MCGGKSRWLNVLKNTTILMAKDWLSTKKEDYGLQLAYPNAG